MYLRKYSYIILSFYYLILSYLEIKYIDLSAKILKYFKLELILPKDAYVFKKIDF